MEDVLMKYPKLLDAEVECDRFGPTSIDQEPVTIDDSPSLKLLWELGALTIQSVNWKTGVTILKGTNREMEINYERLLRKSFVNRNKENFEKFRKAAEDGNFGQMNEFMLKILNRETNLHNERLMQFALFAGFRNLEVPLNIELRAADANSKDIARYTSERKFIDIILKYLKYAYVFELKFEQTAEVALNQLMEKRYCHDALVKPKYAGKSVIGVAVGFKPKLQLSIIHVTATLYKSGGEISYGVARTFEENYK